MKRFPAVASSLRCQRLRTLRLRLLGLNFSAACQIVSMIMLMDSTANTSASQGIENTATCHNRQACNICKQQALWASALITFSSLGYLLGLLHIFSVAHIFTLRLRCHQDLDEMTQLATPAMPLLKRSKLGLSMQGEHKQELHFCARKREHILFAAETG